MNIDIRTLVIVLSIASLLEVFALFVQYRVNKTYRGIGWWVLGYASLAIGYGLLFLRGLVTAKLITVILANGLVILGPVLLYIGVLRFLDRKENRVAVISILAAFILSFLHYTYFDDDFAVRTVIVYGLAATVSLLTAQKLFRYRIRAIAISATVNATLFFVQGCFFAFRAAVALTADMAGGLFSPTGMMTASFLLLFGEGIVTTFGLIIMVNQRLHAEMREAQEALKKSEEQVRLMLNSTAEAIYGIDMQGNCTFANPACFKILGYQDQEALLGRNMHDLIHYAYADGTPMAVKVCKIYQAFREGRRMHVDDEVLWRADGTSFPAEYWSYPQIENGVLYGAVVTFLDITQRKQAQEALKESERKYRELSIIDNLTQLYNSRHFNDQFTIEIDRVKRYGEPLTLIMLDVDDFKRFNDTYGHVEGDQVLARLGQAIKRCLRKTDSAYRYGGEEFTILLPQTGCRDGIAVAERIRTEFAREAFCPSPGQEVHLSMSMGLAQYRPPEDAKTFVNRVDQFMYQAKKTGKDRICAEPDPQFS